MLAGPLTPQDVDAGIAAAHVGLDRPRRVLPRRRDRRHARRVAPAAPGAARPADRPAEPRAARRAPDRRARPRPPRRPRGRARLHRPRRLQARQRQPRPRRRRPPARRRSPTRLERCLRDDRRPRAPGRRRVPAPARRPRRRRATARQAAGATFDRMRAALDEPFRLGGAELRDRREHGRQRLPRGRRGRRDAAPPRRRRDVPRQGERRRARRSSRSAQAAAPLARLSLAARLRRAIDDGELELHYQPICDLDGRRHHAASSRSCAGATRAAASCPPLEFIPVAEQTGVIDALGEWVVDETCRQARAWQDLGLARASASTCRRTSCAAPASPSACATTIRRPRPRARRASSSSSPSPRGCSTPTARCRSSTSCASAGCVLALDDFGAGYSSLSRLLDLPLRDRQGRPPVPRRRARARRRRSRSSTRSCTLAETCGCDVVVEGIETDAQRDVVARHGRPPRPGLRPQPPARRAATPPRCCSSS